MKANGYCHFNENGSNRSFHINLFNKDLRIEQIPGDRLLGHGAVVWDASVIFVKYMEKNMKDYDYHKLNNKKVIELGSGCGLGGIAFTMKGAVVTFTDLKSVVEKLTIKNVDNIYTQLKLTKDVEVSHDMNVIYHKPSIFPIDWTHSIATTNTALSSTLLTNQYDDDNQSKRNETSLVVDVIDTTITTTTTVKEDVKKLVNESEIVDDKILSNKIILTSNISNNNIDSNGFGVIASNAPYDIVLLTDCVFSVELVKHLVQTILCCSGPRTTVLVCHEIRDEDANNAFLKELSKYFSIKKIPMHKLHEEYKNDMVEIIQAKLLRKNK